MANKFLKSWVKKKSKLINIGPEKQWITGLLNTSILSTLYRHSIKLLPRVLLRGGYIQIKYKHMPGGGGAHF